VTWLFVLAAILVIAGGSMAAMGRLGQLPDAEPDLRPEEKDGEPAFDVVVRGYRMDEVDAQIASMQGEIDRLSGREP
jgi:TolA-binding protein